MSMTKQDFEQVATCAAEILAALEAHYDTDMWHIVTGIMADRCSFGNERFDRDKFKEHARRKLKRIQH